MITSDLGLTGLGDASVADDVEEKVREHPWVERLVRPGWFAKGVVYSVMGTLALLIALHHYPDDAASPEGALGVVADQPAGRLLLAVLATGLVLYSAWRVVSVLVVRGWGVREVLERIGYAFSAGFYLVLAFGAFRHAARGSSPDDSYTIERWSRSLMDHGAGRVLLVIAGAVIVGVGAFFVAKAVRREYTEHLRGIGPTWRENRGLGRLIFLAGAIGWFGRGLVTALVGWFVGRAAILFDPADASGFDRSLRKVAHDHLGALVVGVAGALLVVYGVYCLLSAPRRELKESSP